MQDKSIVQVQLGRKPRGFLGVASRCPLGMPETIITSPLVLKESDVGYSVEPFPTVFWLTCPGAIQAVSLLESKGFITKLQDKLDKDCRIQKEYDESARTYAQFRKSLLTQDELDWIKAHRPSWYQVISESGIGGILPGNKGLKCLHAHYADYLARGVNPVGRWVYELLAK